jgi:hypothetical protein
MRQQKSNYKIRLLSTNNIYLLYTKTTIYYEIIDKTTQKIISKCRETQDVHEHIDENVNFRLSLPQNM